jgi:hypothetical protein
VATFSFCSSKGVSLKPRTGAEPLGETIVTAPDIFVKGKIEPIFSLDPGLSYPIFYSATAIINYKNEYPCCPPHLSRRGLIASPLNFTG